MSPLKLVRPTMAPEVIVDAVSAKANWNSTEGEERHAGARRRRGVDAVQEEVLVADEPVAGAELEGEPDRPVQEAAEARVEDALHHDVDGSPGTGRSPASRAMKPACMKNTRNAVTSTHTVLIGDTKSFALWATSCKGAAPAGLSSRVPKVHPPRTRVMPIIFPLSRMAMVFRTSLSRRFESFRSPNLGLSLVITEEGTGARFHACALYVTVSGLHPDVNLSRRSTTARLINAVGATVHQGMQPPV